MSANIDHINILKGKLQQLLKKHEMLIAENNKQKQVIETLQQQEETLTAKLNLLQEQHLLLKSSTAPLNESDKKELEKKINAYLRTIDKCIASLAQ
ncbi:MAG: hypothetical protein JSU03_14395 [Bacteroidetes bacterium]|nr:hypothetical protein [Bacteroidota bacterium]MBS1758437.1 hypothetical protein [Bacteroidota bacterium]